MTGFLLLVVAASGSERLTVHRFLGCSSRSLLAAAEVGCCCLTMHRFVKYILDGLMNILVLAPLVVTYWRGTFHVLDIYLLPDPALRVASHWLSIAVAVVGLLIFGYLQDWMRQRVNATKSPISEIMLKRIYCYFFGLMCVNHWRGVWGLWDIYTGYTLASGLYSFGSGVAILLMTRGFCNTLSPPLIAACDLNDDFFQITTRFQVPRSVTCLYLLDSLFSIVVMGSAVVGVVRGFWYILDNVHEQSIFSYMLSLLAAVLLMIITLFLQKPASIVSAKLEGSGHWWLKIIFEDCYMVLGMMTGINAWRAVWGIWDLYVYPQDRVLSAWIGHVVGQLGLMLMYHASSALVKGISVDGAAPAGQGCFLPSNSLVMFQQEGRRMRNLHERAKEIQRRSIATAAVEEGDDLMGKGVPQMEAIDKDSVVHVKTAPVAPTDCDDYSVSGKLQSNLQRYYGDTLGGQSEKRQSLVGSADEPPPKT
ncbi:hypothetical protein RvY_12588-2 [Ramazzottius varieornatus]|uniref:Uncharacterized protein n=1 Tax=Ramazzottius varieornatus TaxID=947166 RepID=A0A1D1VK05_RAMVA|nr:hypothetical protein RvY_12588-2 [Ramazzottius varieornatus]